MTNKRGALCGNILTTLAFFAGVYTTISLRLVETNDNSIALLVISVLVSLLLSIVLHTMTWVAYVMIGKISDMGWKIFLLVVGILLIVGAIFGIFLATVMLVVISVNGDDLMSVAVVKFLGEVLQLAGGIFFIIAFALKPKTATISNG